MAQDQAIGRWNSGTGVSPVSDAGILPVPGTDGKAVPRSQAPGLDFSPPVESDLAVKMQVAPLVDIVLFLIWFYLLVGQLVMHQKDAAVELPAMDNPMTAREEPAEMIVNLRADGLITIEGLVVDQSVLPVVLARELDKARAARQELRVVVRPDRHQQFANLGQILKTCRDVGFEQVIMRAAAEGTP